MCNNKKITFSIFGCCVSRDIFNFPDSDNFIVNKFIQYSNVYSLYAKPIVNSISVEEFDGSPWQKKCAYYDLNKTVYAELDKVDSDYLIIDVGELRLDTVKIGNVLNEQTCVCLNANTRGFYLDPERPSRYGLTVGNTVSVFDHNDVELVAALEYFCMEIQKRYAPERIILNEVRFIDEYQTKQNILTRYAEHDLMQEDYLSRINQVFSIAESILIKNLAGCHIIRFPENVIGDELHRWGASPLHYHNEYYRYADRSVATIVMGYDRETEDRELELLYEIYSQKFAALHAKATCNMVCMDRDLWKIFSDTFKKMAENPIWLTHEKIYVYPEMALCGEGYKHISIYGYNDP